ncbi:hypothetical protein [Thalassotalea ganghwensis]
MLTFYVAAFLLIALAVIHTYLGERYILTRLFRRDNLPKLFGSDDFTKRTLRFAWHLTSIAWIGFAVIVIQLAQPEVDKTSVGHVIMITFFVHFIIALCGSSAKHYAWIAFLLVSALIGAGLYF